MEGKAGQGRAEQGRAGQGKAGRGKDGSVRQMLLKKPSLLQYDGRFPFIARESGYQLH